MVRIASTLKTHTQATSQPMWDFSTGLVCQGVNYVGLSRVSDVSYYSDALAYTDFDLEKVDNIVISNNVMQISKILSGIYHINSR
jgi:hypothetical protein